MARDPKFRKALQSLRASSIEDSKDVRRSVKQIRDLARTPRPDFEHLHSLEDHLYLAVLQAIAEGTCSDPRACATEAIKSQSIYFPRPCA